MGPAGPGLWPFMALGAVLILWGLGPPLSKLISGPLLGFALAGPLGLSGINRQAAILESSMPTAVMATVLATEYDAAPQFTAGVVLMSTLGSIITVTAVITLL